MRSSWVWALCVAAIVLVVLGVRRGHWGTQQGATAVDTVPDSVRTRFEAFWKEYRLAGGYRVAGRLREAEQAYAAAVQLEPAHEDALYYLGNVRFELGDLSGAAAAWHSLVRTNPQSARGYAQLGMLQSCPDRPTWYRPDSARILLQRAVAINREETGSQVRLGQLQVFRGDWHSAEEALSRVVATNHRSVEAYFLLGYVSWRQRREGEATRALTKAMELARPGTPVKTPLGEGDKKRETPGWHPATGCPSLDAWMARLLESDPDGSRSGLDRLYGDSPLAR